MTKKTQHDLDLFQEIREMGKKKKSQGNRGGLGKDFEDSYEYDADYYTDDWDDVDYSSRSKSKRKKEKKNRSDDSYYDEDTDAAAIVSAGTFSSDDSYYDEDSYDEDSYDEDSYDEDSYDEDSYDENSYDEENSYDDKQETASMNEIAHVVRSEKTIRGSYAGISALPRSLSFSRDVRTNDSNETNWRYGNNVVSSHDKELFKELKSNLKKLRRNWKNAWFRLGWFSKRIPSVEKQEELMIQIKELETILKTLTNRIKYY